MSECKLTGFQQVLVRDGKDECWSRNLFDFFDETSDSPYYCIGMMNYKQCIPYKGNEHLAGTSNPYVAPYIPKDGDFVTMVGEFNGEKATWTCICKEYKDNKIYYYAALNACHELIDEEKNHYDFNPEKYNDEFIRLATEQEKNQLLSKLHEKGKDWDEERKEIVDLKWEPTDGEDFYYPLFTCGEFLSSKATWFKDDIDCLNLRGKGYVFRTDEEATSLCDKLNEAIKNVK